MGGFSIWHILILAIFLLLLFGGNRFSTMMGDVAKGLKSFKQGMADEEDEKRRATTSSAAASRRASRETTRSRSTSPPRRDEPGSAPPPRDDEAR